MNQVDSANEDDKSVGGPGALIEKNFHKGKRAINQFNKMLYNGVQSIIGFDDDPRTDLEHIYKEDELEELRKIEKSKGYKIKNIGAGLMSLKEKAQDFTSGSFKAQNNEKREFYSQIRDMKSVANTKSVNDFSSKLSNNP